VAAVDSLLEEVEVTEDEDFDAGPSGYLGAAPSMPRAKMRANVTFGFPAATAPAQSSGSQTLFAGVPAFTKGEAVLFDTARAEDADQLPDEVTLVRLEMGFPEKAPDADRLDAGLALLLFVDDLTAPRARVQLADLVRQGGVRPLNLRRGAGQRVRVVLAGSWAGAAVPLQVTLHWA
jgi:hypothetical protein